MAECDLTSIGLDGYPGLLFENKVSGNYKSGTKLVRKTNT